LTMNPCYIAFLFGALAVTALGQQTATITVPANQSWTKTGIYLNPGSTVRIEASGVIEAVPPSDTRPLFHNVSPSGRPERQSNKPQPNMPALVMLAKIGDGPVLEAGARAQFGAGGQNGTGELLLGINDDYVADNTGSWTVQVTVTNGDPNMSQQRNRSRSPDNPNQNDRYPNDRYPNDRNPNDRYPNDRHPNDRSQGDLSSRNDNAGNIRSILDAKARQIGRNALGTPIRDVRTAADGIGRYREYRNGAIYWSPDTGAHAVLGQVYDEWLKRGGERGELGYPVSDESSGRDGMSRMTQFQRGTITWNERTGARVDYRE